MANCKHRIEVLALLQGVVQLFREVVVVLRHLDSNISYLSVLSQFVLVTEKKIILFIVLEPEHS